MAMRAAQSGEYAPPHEAEGLVVRIARLVARLAIYYVAGLIACAAYARLVWAVLKDPTLVVKTLRQLRQGGQEVKPPELSSNAWGKHVEIEANGLRFHAVRRGQGQLLLLLHGFPENWFSWRHQLAHFHTRFTVVAVDMRGYGDTERPSGRDAYGIDVLVADVRALVHALGAETCHLAGHDWGGNVAWAFAYQYPHMVQSLTVLNCPHPRGWRNAGLGQALRLWYIVFFQLPVLPELLLSVGDLHFLRMALRANAEHKERMGEREVNAILWGVRPAGALTAALNYYRSLLSPARVRTRGTLRVPTHLIWGERDRVLTPQLSHGTEQWVKPLTVHRIATAGHSVQQDDPAAVNHAMEAFFAAL